MAVNVKLGVDMGSFNSNISTAKTQIRSFDAELKLAESSFKATGDAEAAMTAKTQALNGKLQTQQKMVQQYSKALQQMKDAGIEPTSKAYVQMQTQMLNAQAGMMETQDALNGLDGSQKQAASSADQLAKSVNGIGKKISLEQVISGIDRVTGGLENAARKAVQLGEQIFSAVMDKARWADDTATMALMYGIPLERFLQMQKLVQNGMDTSVDAILGAQSRLARGIGSENKAAMEALRDLGVSMKTLEDTGDGILEFVDKDPEETFFEIGRALMEMNKAYDKEAAAQALFGRSWKELVPLFKEYKTLDEYNKALKNTKTNSEEDVTALVELNDKVGELKGNLETLSTDIMATLAPALTEGANALNGMLESILEYLRTPEGQQMLTDLGNAVSGLFEDLGKIDPEQTVQSFTKVFTNITGGVQWLAENKQGVVDALTHIVKGWALLKLTGGALDILKLVQGVMGLSGGGGLGGTIASALSISAPTLAVAALTITAATVLLHSAIVNDPYKRMTEGGKEAREAYEAFNETVASQSTNEPLKALHELLANYNVPKGDKAAMESLPAMVEFAKGYLSGKDNGKMVTAARELVAELGEEFETNFAAAMETLVEGNTDTSTKSQQHVVGMVEDLMIAVREKMTNEVLEVKMEPEENAAAYLAAQVGTVHVPVSMEFVIGSGASAGAGGVVGDLEKAARAMIFAGKLKGPGYANGIPYVPDTRLAWLHEGETVTPAREVSRRSFSSNLYVEKMYMSGGTDARGLADEMAAAQRRTMNGYGS